MTFLRDTLSIRKEKIYNCTLQSTRERFTDQFCKNIWSQIQFKKHRKNYCSVEKTLAAEQ